MLIFFNLQVLGCLTSGHTRLSLRLVAFLRRPLAIFSAAGRLGRRPYVPAWRGGNHWTMDLGHLKAEFGGLAGAIEHAGGRGLSGTSKGAGRSSLTRLCVHGLKYAHAFWAAWNCGELGSAVLLAEVTKPPRGLGSGNFGTPCLRMQAANASSCSTCWRIWAAVCVIPAAAACGRQRCCAA